MKEIEVRVVNLRGLHARAAARLVQTANHFQSQIILVRDNMQSDAKSILGVLLLAAPQGTRLRVVAVPLKLSQEDVQEEIRRFQQALAQSKKQLKEIRDHLARMLGKGHALILDAQLHLLEDPAIVRTVRDRIASQYINAEWALELVLRELHQKFQAISDAYLQERWSDVRDVIRRVQSNLMGTRHQPVLEPGEAAVLVADELALSLIHI